MSISGISCIHSAFSGSSILSEEIRAKLLALGIDPSTVTSEVQALKLIQSLSGIPKVQETSKTNVAKTYTGELDLLAKAKILASKMGITTRSNETLDEILTKIAAKLKEMEVTNPQAAKVYAQELDEIKTGYIAVKQNENEMFIAMNYTANLNKMILGL